MPVSAKLALAALLAATILRAFFGPPPAGDRHRQSLAAGVLGGLAYAAALLSARAGELTAASVLMVGAVETLCLAVWLARGRDDRSDGGPPDEPDPPVDWEEFDRERERWARPRTPVG